MKTVEDEISSTLEGIVSATTRRSLFNRLGGLATTPIHQLSGTDRRLILLELEASIRLFAPEESPRVLALCTRILDQPIDDLRPSPPRREATLSEHPHFPRLPPRFAVAQSEDVSRIRLETWDEAVRLGFDKRSAIQIASAGAELARLILIYAVRGTIELLEDQDEEGTAVLEIVARDDGPAAGPGANGGRELASLSHLADDLQVDSRPGAGTTIVCRFYERSVLRAAGALPDLEPALREI